MKTAQLKWGYQIIPVTPSHTITINYAGPPNTVPSISLWDFVQAARAGNKEQIRKWVEGKAVLLGPDNEIEDRHATPYYTAFSGNSLANSRRRNSCEHLAHAASIGIPDAGVANGADCRSALVWPR